MNIPVITIDGPSGSGKGSISLLLARKLGWHLLDSGAIYRILAYAALERQISDENIEGLCHLASQLDVEFSKGEEEVRVILDSKDITDSIRTPECTARSSEIAAIEEVRRALLQRQRDFCQSPGLVADGRDMGTVVFPAAKYKFFLTASPEERALRRHKQLKNKGIDVSLASLLKDIKERDERDTNRSVAPLKPAEGAIVIDSTHLNMHEVLGEILSHSQS